VTINGRIEQGSAALWQVATEVIEHAVEQGWLKP
jgi:putative hydrolase of HD superfamily